MAAHYWPHLSDLPAAPANDGHDAWKGAIHIMSIEHRKVNEPGELTKSKAVITVEIVEYVPNSVVIKTIMHKTTGNVSVMSVDSGEGLTERTTPFDTYVQVIDGKADIVINGLSHVLETGQSIVIPAHASHSIQPNGRFKLVMTVIKSGYE
jgi:quercetin dioxygenase-like cupin family protein